MTDQLPTIESLNEAARAAGCNSWERGEPHSLVARFSIIAHARTLDTLHNRTPVDPDVEALERVLQGWYGYDRQRCGDGNFHTALAQYKAEKAKWEGRE